MAAKDSLDRFLQQDENRRSLSRPCSNAVNLPAFGYQTTGNANAFTTLPAYGETSNPARGQDHGRQGGWAGGVEQTVGRQIGVSYVPPPHHTVQQVYPVLSGVPNYYGDGMQPQPMQWMVPVQNTILPGRDRGHGWGSGQNSRRNTPVAGELGSHHLQKEVQQNKGAIQRVDVSPLPVKTSGRSIYASSVNNTEAEVFGRKVDIKPYSRTYRCEKSTLMSKRTQPKVNVCFQPSKGTFAGKLIVQPPGGPSSLSLG